MSRSPMDLENEVAHELERQRHLLMAIQGLQGPGALQGWVDAALGCRAGGVVGHSATAVRGLAAYVANAGAAAERALASNYPTVQALVGHESFAQLARALWRRRHPARGDLGWFSEALPDFLDQDELLPDVPYLSDVARLDWVVSRAEVAADVDADPQSFHALALDPAHKLYAVLAPGAELLGSSWPVATVWQAHHEAVHAADPFVAAREAIAARRAECAWVWRAGWQVRVERASPQSAAFVRSLLRQDSLGEALDQAGPGFDFAGCLEQGLQQGWWLGMSSEASSATRAP